MTEELKACPWCGNKPAIASYADTDDEGINTVFWQVFCTSSCCEIQPLREYLDTEEECVTIWNTRLEPNKDKDTV